MDPARCSHGPSTIHRAYVSLIGSLSIDCLPSDTRIIWHRLFQSTHLGDQNLDYLIEISPF
jgi:hypothetical protein